MKKLTGKHIFAMAKIIKAANLKEELGEIIEKAQNGEMSTEKVGIEGFMAVVTACGDGAVAARSCVHYLNK